jgi:1-acyl-sn-glycerol-3-phosphate acyltransferase
MYCAAASKLMLRKLCPNKHHNLRSPATEMKNALLRIWSLWFYFLFTVFFALIFPCHFVLLRFDKKWTHNLAHRLNMVWGYVILYPAGVWVIREGHSRLDRKQVYLFTANHSSYLDIPICNVSVLPSFRFVGKAELNSTPLFGYMFKRLHIPVNRSSVTESFKSFLHAKQKLKSGTSVLVFPEGTIPDKTKVTLLKFKDGAFRMAIENKVPVVPVTIIGADKAMPDNGKFLLHPSRVRVVFHAPIDTSEMVVADSAALREQVFEIIHETLTGKKRPEDLVEVKQ